MFWAVCIFHNILLQFLDFFPPIPSQYTKADSVTAKSRERPVTRKIWTFLITIRFKFLDDKNHMTTFVIGKFLIFLKKTFLRLRRVNSSLNVFGRTEWSGRTIQMDLPQSCDDLFQREDLATVRLLIIGKLQNWSLRLVEVRGIEPPDSSSRMKVVVFGL